MIAGNERGAKSADRVDALVESALAAARDDDASPAERAEMLMELAIGVQQRPKTPDHFRAAVTLYDEALAICPADAPLLAARIAARKGTALQALPEGGMSSIEAAHAMYERALPTLRTRGQPEETAEAEMNLGLVLQQLAGAGRARVADAIAAYRRALQTFEARRFPAEFAILQNNLATAFLAMPLDDERVKLREALAVQCFEEALKAVDPVDHPAEYAMLQNNLGNALQYAASGHPLQNNLRALAAYEEALKIRTRATAPLQYANTVANKANCLWNLPDDPDRPAAGNRENLMKARACYEEAREIFLASGEPEKARLVAESLEQIEREISPDGRPALA